MGVLSLLECSVYLSQFAKRLHLSSEFQFDYLQG